MQDKLEEYNYHSVTFDQPDVGRIISIQFNIEELETDNQMQSSYVLKKRMNHLLKDTNWRLMSDGINYRLGLMTGRIRAYEAEEDLLRLVNARK